MHKLTFTNSLGSTFTASTGGSPFSLGVADVNSVGISAITQKPIQYDGQVTLETSLNPRTITAEITIIGILGGRYSHAEYYRLWEQIQRALLPGKAYEGKLQYANEGGKYWIRAYPYAMPNPERLAATGTFTVEFIADYPYWQAETLHTHTFTSGFNYITNESGMPVPFTVELSQMETVLLINATTGGIISISGELGTYTKLVIDTQACTVKKYVGAEWEYANHLLTADSDYKPLAAGQNKIYFTNWGSSASAKITWYDHFLGV